MISIINLCRKFDPFLPYPHPAVTRGPRRNQPSPDAPDGDVAHWTFQLPRFKARIHQQSCALQRSFASGCIPSFARPTVRGNLDSRANEIVGSHNDAVFSQVPRKKLVWELRLRTLLQFRCHKKKKGQPIRSAYQRRSASFLLVYTVEFRGRQIHREHDYMAYA